MRSHHAATSGRSSFNSWKAASTSSQHARSRQSNRLVDAKGLVNSASRMQSAWRALKTRFRILFFIQSHKGDNEEDALFWDSCLDTSCMEASPTSEDLRIFGTTSSTSLAINCHKLNTLHNVDIRFVKPNEANHSTVKGISTARRRFPRPPKSRSRTAISLWNLDDDCQNRLLWWLMVGVCEGESLEPYREISSGKASQQPLVNFLIAFCGSKDRQQLRMVEKARCLLYGSNAFAFRDPLAFCRFVKCIGASNLERLPLGENVHFPRTFFTVDLGLSLNDICLSRWAIKLMLLMHAYPSAVHKLALWKLITICDIYTKGDLSAGPLQEAKSSVSLSQALQRSLGWIDASSRK